MKNKIKEIFKAWITSSNPNTIQKNVAKYRLAVCKTCRRYKKIFSFTYCNACGCPLAKKVYAENKESCSENKWKQ